MVLLVILFILETAMRSLGADIATFFPQTANDFSEISWAHAVNSRLQLHNSLHGTYLPKIDCFTVLKK